MNRIADETEVVLPLHPRTQKSIRSVELHPRIRIVEPVGYLEMLYLIQRCEGVITDSGGLQKEAFWMGRPCITIREETEWIELVEGGVNLLANREEEIVAAFRSFKPETERFSARYYGDGNAAEIIVRTLADRTNTES